MQSINPGVIFPCISTMYMCADNTQRLRAFSTIATTTTRGSKEINYSRAGVWGCGPERIHPLGELFWRERHTAGGGKGGRMWPCWGPHLLQLKTLIPQGDIGPSPYITVPIHFSILQARRLIRSALASLSWTRFQIARSEAQGRTIPIQQHDAHTRTHTCVNVFADMHAHTYWIIKYSAFGQLDLLWFENPDVK